MTKSVVITVIAAIALVVAAPGVNADSATAVITVSATVRQNCAISTTPLAYGAYDPIGANATNPLDGTGTVVLRCTRGTTAAIALDGGANASGTVRRMTNAATAFLTYELYKDSAHSQIWTDTTDGMLSAGSAPNTDPRSFTVYGRVAGAQDVPVGSFTDSVVATVNF